MFAFDPGRRLFTKLHDFTGATGAHPYAALERGADGQLYGTTFMGGASNVGTVYRIDDASRVLLVHSFKGSDGKFPRGALARGSNGRLYGTTSDGVASGNGVIYRVSTGDTASDPPPPTGESSLDVTAPRRNASWTIGASRVIRWAHDAAPDLPVRIELSRDGGTSWSVISSSAANGPGAGEYTWTVTGPATSRARFRVTIANGPTDTSALFSIRP